jgi:hypothetical protein
MPDDDVAGTVKELIRKYEGDDLAAFKRETIRKEYQGRVRRIRPAFGKQRYAKTGVQAMLPGHLSAVAITKHLYDNRTRAMTASAGTAAPRRREGDAEGVPPEGPGLDPFTSARGGRNVA